MARVKTRAVTFASGELRLKGALHLPPITPAPGVVVCHPHSLYGGDMDNNVVVAACESLAGAGCLALRFNFRGAGTSDGAFDEGRGERTDLIAALDYLFEQPEVDRARIGAAGYSFGAMVVAEIASAELTGLALISPPLATSDLRVEWGCPALLLAGTEDDIAPAERLRLVAAHSKAEVQIFDGADHSWWGYEHELSNALVDFFSRRFA